MNKFSKKQLLTVFLLLIILVSIPLGLFLVKQQQDARSRASEKPAASPSGPVFDSRFALAGDCVVAESMGIKEFYGWGTGGDANGYPNKAEYDCLRRFPNLKFFYSLGHEGRGFWFKQGSNTEIEIRRPSGIDDFEAFKTYATQFKDQEDRDNYRQLQELDLYKRVGAKNDFVLYSYLLIPKYVADNPGAVYAIGNEPDLGKLTPEEYAKMYHIYYTRIKKFDPTAKVMMKGITTVTMDGKDPFLASSADRQKVTKEKNWWAREFREAYKRLYGNYPQVDIWAIHPYASAGGGNGEQTINYIKDFRDNFLREIGEPKAELWLTEFGPAGDKLPPEDPLGWDRGIAENYMPNVLRFLKETDYIQKWFYYVGDNYTFWVYFNQNGQLKPEFNCTFDPNKRSDSNHKCILNQNGTLNHSALPSWGYPDIGAIWCTRANDCSQLNRKGEAYKTFAHQAPYTPTIANTQPPDGSFDTVDSNCTLYGWAKDPDSARPIKIHVYMDGPASRGTWVTEATADGVKNPGESIPNNSRFRVPLPNFVKDSREHDIYIYGIDVTPNSHNPQLRNSPKRIKCTSTGGGLVSPRPSATPANSPTSSGSPTTRPTPTATPTSSPNPRTGVVGLIFQNFGQSGNQNNGDLNGDGRINELDFAIAISRN